MTVILRNSRKETEREFETRSEAEEQKRKLVELGMKPGNLTIEEQPKADGGTPEVVETETADADVVAEPEQLAQDPIGWLEAQNADFVNEIKGTPAISKMGFRFIQSQFGISTESEVVHSFDDPVGVVVWARAELPDGQSAEAHGEGYLGESTVDDNEFVRYADTRAKNRAISDLTSAGALAVSELSGE